MNSSANADKGADRGLPPVTPPSGRFIAQLFLVPGMIVALAILLLMMFRYLIGESYTSESFLRQIDSGNADVRWRGAADLAQVLKRAESVHLKADPAFALDLTQRLRTALDDLDRREKDFQASLDKMPPAEQEKAWLTLAPLRNNVAFLSAALGEFHVPVAIPLLGEIVLRTNSPDLQGSTQLRRQATWALANLGNNLRDFAKLPPEPKEAALTALAKESAGANPDRSLWARTALYYLDKSKQNELTPAGVVRADEILAKAAEADDRLVREMVAMALAFWEGPLVEPTLVKLSHDRGDGTLIPVNDPE